MLTYIEIEVISDNCDIDRLVSHLSSEDVGYLGYILEELCDRRPLEDQSITDLEDLIVSLRTRGTDWGIAVAREISEFLER